MMGIAQKVARDFTEGVRSRGQSYYAKGRVVILAAAVDDVTAKVRGTTHYRVRLRMRGGRLLASCTCPYFGPTGAPCKHIWATVLAVDARSLLYSPPIRPLTLVPVPPKKKGPAPAGPGPGSGPGPAVGSLPAGPPPGPGSGPGPGFGFGPGANPPGAAPGPPWLKGRTSPGPGPGPGSGPGPNRGLPVPKGRAKGRPGSRVPGPAARPPVKVVVAKRRLFYVLDVPATLAQNQVVIDLARRERRPGVERGPLKPWWHSPATGAARTDPEDLELLAMLGAARGESAPGANGAGAAAEATAGGGVRRFVVAADRQAELVERLCRSGRCRLRRTEGEEDPPTLRWDDGPPWQFGLDVRPDPGGKRWAWRGSLHRHEARMDLAEPMVLVPGLLILGAGRAARFDDAGIPLWVARIRQEKELVFGDVQQQDIMLGKILEEARVSPSALLEYPRLVEVNRRPQPCLTLRTPRQNWGSGNLLAEVEFDYDDIRIPAAQAGRVAVRSELRRAIYRDEAIEAEARVKLFELGFRESKDLRVEPGTLELSPKKMDQAVRELVQAGWRVEAEGQLIRPASEFKLAVTSGIDWFELDGQVAFGDQSIPLPELLEAAGRGEEMITLGDGSVGMLPEDWLKKYGALAELGTAANGTLRFGRAQASLLDALLAAQPEVRVDASFDQVRRQLRGFQGVEPLEAPAGFRGTLRPYQREGLGWLDYLRRFGFGGILADDMGLGKTIQVLALLQRRNDLRQAEGPSLIVVPRSLVFNWVQEAQRFTPGLRVLDYTGPRRAALRKTFAAHDLIVTTYGTLRTDVVELGKTEFDYVILDEAQAIKNAGSQVAKASRLLRGRHRLAMSGTPIENHLGELWSIFEFLNPGMLGGASVFKGLATSASGQDEGTRPLLARSLRPFILRRTKGQVVADLPEKTEQILYCSMEPAQRRRYEELRSHYRQALLKKDPSDLRKSKIE
ncbi:MAG TPA: SNF2-related protein, partial [Isosphaeraceae bacterium]